MAARFLFLAAILWTPKKGNSGFFYTHFLSKGIYTPARVGETLPESPRLSDPRNFPEKGNFDGYKGYLSPWEGLGAFWWRK